jgi:hypothetical protein
VGTEPVDTGDRRSAIEDFCRQIEIYLCQKNDGHLIRVVGPSFGLVAAWAEQGVPLTVAFKGIDRYFERYYRKGPRRRPVKIDFCEADVLEVFDEWRRAVGVAASSEAEGPNPANRHASLPAHLERVVRRLTSGRADGSLGAEFDEVIDRVSVELDAARAKTGGLRGDARHALIDRLAMFDAELLRRARATLDEGALESLAREADEELAGFRSGMTPETFARASESAIDRLVRERCRLPVVTFS